MNATKRKPKPITANPLFPFVTALWFATLLGLGSFATAPMVLEGPVIALGIPALIPAATPPLGFTARVMFAFAMLVVGAIFGFVLGRFLGRDKVVVPVRTRDFGKNVSTPPMPKRRPINATEDLGAPLDAPAPGRDAVHNSAYFQADALPAAATPAIASSSAESIPQFANGQDLQCPASSSSPPDEAANLDPLDLELLLQEADAIEQSSFVASEPIFAAPPSSRDLPPVTSGIKPFAPTPMATQEAHAQEAASDPVLPTPLDTYAAPKPSFPAFAQTPAFDPAPVQPIPDAQPAPFLQARAVDATPIDRAPLETLGLVQLIERLALAISRRELRADRAEPAQPVQPDTSPLAPEISPAFARFEPSPTAVSQAAMPRVPAGDERAEDALPAKAFVPVQTEQVQAGSSWVGSPKAGQPERVVQLRPAALQPLQTFSDELDDIDSDDSEPDAGLERFLRMSPLLSRKSEQVAAAFSSGTDIVPEPEVAEECYPSLLDMGPVVARREPLRIDDSVLNDADVIEPVVVFPGQEASRSGEAGRAGVLPHGAIPAAPSQTAPVSSRPFERPSVLPTPGSPLASPGRAAPSAHDFVDDVADDGAAPVNLPEAEEADRALRAALATLQRMTARG